MKLRTFFPPSILLALVAIHAPGCGGDTESSTSQAVSGNAGGAAGSGGGASGSSGQSSTTGGAGGEAVGQAGQGGGDVAGAGGSTSGSGGATAGGGGASGTAGGGAGGAAHSGIGDPCTGPDPGSPPMFKQGSCAMGQQCIPEGTFGSFPGGYCTEDCSSDPTVCPSDSKCVGNMSGTHKRCYLSCNTDADCRDGYQCNPTSKVCRAPFNGGGNAQGVTPGTNNGMACVMPVVDPPTPSPVFDPDQQLTAGLMQAEVEVAADANGHVLVSWIDIQSTGAGKTGYVFSSDGGKTFGKIVRLPIDKTVDMNSDQSDPVVAVDTMGRFYISWVGFDRDTTNPNNVMNMHIWVARINPDGTFDQIFEAGKGEWTANNFLDKPWIASSPVDGSLLVTWDRSTNTGVDIRMARSTDGGQTWSAPITISDTNDRPSADRNLAQVTIAPDGKGYVTWVELNGNNQFGSTSNQVYFQRIATDGTKDGKNVLVSHDPDSPTFEDPSIAVSGSNVYVGFISGTSAGAWDVHVAASLDGGDTFQPAVKANDDATCATHFHHQIAADANGNVHVVYYDNRYLKGNVFHQVAPAATASAPLAFGPSTFVNTGSFTFDTSRANMDWLGDYLGLWTAGGSIYAAWTDPRLDGTSHIWFAKGQLKLRGISAAPARLVGVVRRLVERARRLVGSSPEQGSEDATTAG